MKHDAVTSQQPRRPIPRTLPAGEDAVTQFHVLTPKQAIEIVQAAGAEHPAKLISDHAAAGLVRSYAQIQVTIDARGERTSVRGAAIAPLIWERMIRDGVDGDAWTGGTVRLAGSDLVVGEPAVHVTGITFNPTEVERLASQQRSTPQVMLKRAARIRVAAPAAMLAPPEAEDRPAQAPRQRKVPDLSALHSGALHLTVEQTKAALSIGHTTLYKLLNAGDLERAPSKAGTRITAESVRRYAGLVG